ncbi:MAG: cytochrome c biogenesis protein CcsA, partial [Sphingomonas sp.]
MIAEGGLAALWIAAAMALVQLVLGGSAARSGSEELMRATRKIAIVQGLLVSLAFLMLIWLFVESDMSVLLVATNSHSAKPLIYKIAGAWGNHEGSMLLWVTVLGIAGAGVAIFEKRLGGKTLAATLSAQAVLAIGFYAFLLLASNPFLRVDPPAPDGQGLNPLLQDPGLAFHPPTLYLGYVGLSVAFSFAVGALLMRDVGPAFAKAMRPWVLAAWI